MGGRVGGVAAHAAIGQPQRLPEVAQAQEGGAQRGPVVGHARRSEGQRAEPRHRGRRPAGRERDMADLREHDAQLVRDGRPAERGPELGGPGVPLAAGQETTLSKRDFAVWVTK
jgi:hypothetical protein